MIKELLLLPVMVALGAFFWCWWLSFKNCRARGKGKKEERKEEEEEEEEEFFNHCL